MINKNIKVFSLFFLVLLFASCKDSETQLGKDFVNPPLSLKSRPLWFWNKPLSREQTLKVMKASKEAGYYGLGILPSYGMTPEFMTPEYLAQYKAAVEIADSLKMKLYLYDEFYFPSGMAGGMLAKQYPEAVSKRLDMDLFEVQGLQSFTHPLPDGTVMGAVGMENTTLERIDLSGQINKDHLTAELPAGNWKVMIFTLNPDSSSGRNHCDYLSPEAVHRFIELTYEKYFQTFPEHFGTTIDYAFYDEPCLRWVDGARTWTGEYNNKFRAKFGFSPVMYYPALWFDIGHETEVARNALLGFRAELYAAGFPKTINDWCRAHKIQLTGHVDQEEIVNPVATCGDLMKAFKYQDIPAVDQIFYYGRSNYIYKVISSSANNYDRPTVATECYGAIGGMPVKNLYKEAMDQFAKGINLMEPHAVWYTDAVDIQPDLSPTGKKYGAALPAFNEYIGRLQCMLQGGQHVADIGILYPIASLQGSYHFGPGDPGMGGVIPAEADYLDIGEMLSLDIRRDFTYIHPEILDEKCTIEQDKIQLMNALNHEEFKVFIIPGSQTIQLSNLQKIKNFYDQGGAVIATSVLPDHASELGKDEEVKQIIQSMFGEDAYHTKDLPRVTASGNWNTGGFIPSYAIDGRLETSWKPSQGNLKDEWLEIGFGGERTVDQVAVKSTEDQVFSCSVFLLNRKGVVGANLRSPSANLRSPLKSVGGVKMVEFGGVGASGVRIVLDSGAIDKVSVPEVEILDLEGRNIISGLKTYTLHTNNRGGKAYFIPAPNSAILKTILDATGLAWDVRFEKDVTVTGGNLTYLHKRLNGKDFFFFANSSENGVDVPVVLRGELRLQVWNPHDGQISECVSTTETIAGVEFTHVQLKLEAERSVFWVGDLPLPHSR
ncbi:MAG: glycosyl hydrolase [Bacteroidia bacterium]|nr:glycosyl hydrolase [Bacteroidia bacterium]